LDSPPPNPLRRRIKEGKAFQAMSIFKRLDHVAIGVVDSEKARKLFVDVFGATPLKDKGVQERDGFTWETFLLGGKKVEIVSAIKPGQGGVGRYIEKHGEGIHHITLGVENLDAAIAYFESRGVRVLARNVDDPYWKHCYLHPGDTFGAMFQVFEENDRTLASAE
jgi:methylmalonyl-CoA/ethylmalonyl-CoA epimerase